MNETSQKCICYPVVSHSCLLVCSALTGIEFEVVVFYIPSASFDEIVIILYV